MVEPNEVDIPSGEGPIVQHTAQMLSELPYGRRRHCLEVGRKAAQAGAEVTDPIYLPDLVTAAQLHDIGYTPRWTVYGFHPVDGAAALAGLGFSDLTCHLVAHHTGATREAQSRGLPLEIFTPYASPLDQAPQLLSVLTWADLNTGPDGTTISVAERVEEILTRYAAGDPVHRHVSNSREWLLAAGAHPLGSIHASS